jgi:hypothetical protein
MTNNHAHSSDASAGSNIEANATIIRTGRALFPIGTVLATRGALSALHSSGFQPIDLLARHICGIWGDVVAEDSVANDLAVTGSMRILSVHRLVSADLLAAMPRTQRERQKTIWIITEWDRSVTTSLTPSEY